MKTTTYTLPAHWAPAMINGDFSGMTDEEESALLSWLADHADEISPTDAMDCTTDPEFRHSHDADGYELAGDCLTYTFTTFEETAK